MLGVLCAMRVSVAMMLRLPADNLETSLVHITYSIHAHPLNNSAYDTDQQQQAIVIADSRFGSGNGPIFLSQLSCRGDESDILSCGSPSFVHYCTHEEDVGIKCPGTYIVLLIWITCLAACKGRGKQQLCSCNILNPKCYNYIVAFDLCLVHMCTACELVLK